MLFPPEIFALPQRTAAGEQISSELHAQAAVAGADAQPLAGRFSTAEDSFVP